MKTLSNILCLIVFSIILSSCSHEPVKAPVKSQRAQWSSKAQVKDLERQSVQGVQIEILAVKNEKLRLEVSAIMGIPVATVVLNRNQLKAAIYTEKKFVQGVADENSLQKLLKVPLSAKWIYAIAFDESPGKAWNCEVSILEKSGAPQSCTLAQYGYKIEWSRKDNGSKFVHITTPKTEINWYFKEPQYNFEEKPESFLLPQPQGYKLQQL